MQKLLENIEKIFERTLIYVAAKNKEIIDIYDDGYLSLSVGNARIPWEENQEFNKKFSFKNAEKAIVYFKKQGYKIRKWDYEEELKKSKEKEDNTYQMKEFDKDSYDFGGSGYPASKETTIVDIENPKKEGYKNKWVKASIDSKDLNLKPVSKINVSKVLRYIKDLNQAMVNIDKSLLSKGIVRLFDNLRTTNFMVQNLMKKGYKLLKKPDLINPAPHGEKETAEYLTILQKP